MISKKLLVVCLTPFIFETNVIFAGEAPSEPVTDANVATSNPPVINQDYQDTNMETPINNAADMQAMFDDTRMNPVIPASTQNPPVVASTAQGTDAETPIDNAADTQAMFDDTRTSPVISAPTQNPPVVASTAQGANAETPIDNAADMRAMFGDPGALGGTFVPAVETPINEAAPPPPPPAPIASNPTGNAKWVDTGQRDVYGNIIYSRAPATRVVAAGAVPAQNKAVGEVAMQAPPPAPITSNPTGNAKRVDTGQRDVYGNIIYSRAPTTEAVAPVATPTENESVLTDVPPPPPVPQKNTAEVGSSRWIDSGEKDEYGRTIYYRVQEAPVASPPPLSTQPSGNVKWIDSGRKDEYGNTIYEREGKQAKPSVENEADRIAKEAEERLKAETKAAEEAAVAAKSADRKTEELNEKVDTLTLEIAGLRESLGGSHAVANEEPKTLLGADGKEIVPTMKNPDGQEVSNPEYEKALATQQEAASRDIAAEGTSGNSLGKAVVNEGQAGQTFEPSEKAQVGADLQKAAKTTESADPDGLATAGQIDGVNAKLDALLKAQSVELREQAKLETKVDEALNTAHASIGDNGHTSSVQAAIPNQETTRQNGGTASVAAGSLPSVAPTGNIENGSSVVPNAGGQNTVDTLSTSATSPETLLQGETSVEPVGAGVPSANASALTESPATQQVSNTKAQKPENSKDATVVKQEASQQPAQIAEVADNGAQKGSSEAAATKWEVVQAPSTPNVSTEKSGEPKEAASGGISAKTSEEGKEVVASSINSSETGVLATKIIDSLQQLKRIEEALNQNEKAVG